MFTVPSSLNATAGPVPLEFAVKIAGAAGTLGTVSGALASPRYCTTTCTLDPLKPGGTIAETWPADTYTRPAAVPLKVTLTPARTCGGPVVDGAAA